MRIAVVSDIHGNLPALEAVLEEIARERVDAIVNLGDILSGPLWPAETADRLIALHLPTIRGNHERQLLGDPARIGLSDAQTRPQLTPCHLQWTATTLPTTIELAEGTVLCVHGTPASDLEYLLETVTPDHGVHGSPGVRAARGAEIEMRLGELHPEALLCGHTHMPRTARCGTTLIVNPGSVGLPAFDDDRHHFHLMETGTPHARWAIVERTAAGWQAQLRLTVYDWESAARRAEAQLRPDWADALRTGRVGRSEADLPGSAHDGPPSPAT
jgi:putative phosphoesterase